jgi:Carboxypeptidase regulatory-like domain
MRARFALGAVAMTAALAVLSGGVALAQTRPPVASTDRAAGANARAALATQQRISPTEPHLVSGVVLDLTGHGLGGVCVLATGTGTGTATDTDGLLPMARTSASGRYVMSLPHAGPYLMQYHYCQPGKAAVSALAPLVARQIEVGASPISALPATTLRLAPQTSNRSTSNRSALGAAGIAVPQEGQIIRLHAGDGLTAREPAASGPPDVGGLTGRVTNPAGKPLAAVCVWVEGNSFAEATATTRSGTYKFGADELSPGSYLILFTSSCAPPTNPFAPVAPGSWAPEWYKGKFTHSQADQVKLRAHVVTAGINAVMQHAAQISGVVTGSDGRRIKNACALVLANPNLTVGQATTNSSGAYKVTGLDPGTYRVLVLPACDGASVYGQVWYPRAQAFSTASAVPARLGHLTSGINVVVPKLGSITGMIRLGGKTGKPLGGICVSAMSTADLSAGGFVFSRPNGTYSIDGLAAGSYQVDASAGCGDNGNYASASYPHPVPIVKGKVAAGIDLYLQPGATLAGTVTDAATAKPLGGICVSDSNGDFGVTNAAGTYTIDQLPAGRTTVAFAGGCGNQGSYAPQCYDDQASQATAQPLLITAGHVTRGINAAMLPGATIAGRVTNSAGRPVSGVCLGILPAYLGEFGSALFGGNTSTNASGSYVVTNLAPGDYTVAFFSGCFGPSNTATLQWFKGQQTQETAGMVDAPAGIQVTGIDAVISPGGAIAGTVASTTGQAVDFDCVTAINRRTGQPSGFQSLTGGSFTVSSLAPGTYTVVASDCSGGNHAMSIYQRPVTVRAGRTTGNIALRLPPGGVVTGRVTAASNRRPVPNACVEATPLSVAAAALGIGSGALTNGSGTYKIVGLPTGSYRIEIFPNCVGSAVNLRTVTLPRAVRVTQGKVTAKANGSLPIGGSIVGQVTGPDAATVSDACVEAYPIWGGSPDDTSTGADGKYVLTGLTPGRYKVEFGDPFCSDGMANLGTQWYDGAADRGAATIITVKAGGTASAVNAALPADGAITGSVTGTSASGLSGVCVSAVPLATGESAIFTVSGRGTYTLAALPPGQYRVEFQAGCGRTGLKTQWWQDAASSTAAKILTVRAGATISGIDALMTGG